jgi:WD40 repeat protein
MDYKEKKIYYKYANEEKVEERHIRCTINKVVNSTYLIETSYLGNIRIWNFHTGKLINKINIALLHSACLWDDNLIFVGAKDNSIKLVDLKSGTVIKSSLYNKDGVLTMKKIIHPKYGECLVYRGFNPQIKLAVMDI